MNIPPDTKPKTHPFINKVEEEAKEAFFLSVYFASWFCALTFLAATSLNERPIPLAIFGVSLIKAALCAKFMLIGQAIVPIKVNKDYGILKSLFIESLIYLMVVLSLNYLEAGIHGLIKGKSFINSMADFDQSNPLKVVAMCIVYWLIVWPYLIFNGMKLIMGRDKMMNLFFGDRNQAKH
jgi:hypothetical protein